MFSAPKKETLKIVNFQTFALSDEKTLLDQQKDNNKDKDNDKYIQRLETFQPFDDT